MVITPLVESEGSSDSAHADGKARGEPVCRLWKLGAGTGTLVWVPIPDGNESTPQPPPRGRSEEGQGARGRGGHTGWEGALGCSGGGGWNSLHRQEPQVAWLRSFVFYPVPEASNAGPASSIRHTARCTPFKNALKIGRLKKF